MTKLYEDIRSDKSKTISIVIYYTSITLTLLTLILQIYLILISDYQIQARQILENIDREKLSSLVYNTPSIESYLNDEPILIQQIYGIQSDSKKENQDYENLNFNNFLFQNFTIFFNNYLIKFSILVYCLALVKLIYNKIMFVLVKHKNYKAGKFLNLLISNNLCFFTQFINIILVVMSYFLRDLSSENRIKRIEDNSISSVDISSENSMSELDKTILWYKQFTSVPHYFLSTGFYYELLLLTTLLSLINSILLWFKISINDKKINKYHNNLNYFVKKSDIYENIIDMKRSISEGSHMTNYSLIFDIPSTINEYSVKSLRKDSFESLEDLHQIDDDFCHQKDVEDNQRCHSMDSRTSSIEFMDDAILSHEVV